MLAQVGGGVLCKTMCLGGMLDKSLVRWWLLVDGGRWTCSCGVKRVWKEGTFEISSLVPQHAACSE